MRSSLPSRVSFIRSRFLIFAYCFILLLAACKKELQRPPEYQKNDELTFTILDKTNQQPLSEAEVSIGYGNNWGDRKMTDALGKVTFIVPDGWVLNEVMVLRKGYSRYWYYPNSTGFSRNQTLSLEKIAFLRFHVKNEAPAAASDKLVIYSSNPNGLAGYEFIFAGAGIDSTFISDANAGNLGISCNRFVNDTFVNSFYVNVNAVSNDTTDVLVNY
jgi:hypothetical protein